MCVAGPCTFSNNTFSEFQKIQVEERAAELTRKADLAKEPSDEWDRRAGQITA